MSQEKLESLEKIDLMERLYDMLKPYADYSLTINTAKSLNKDELIQTIHRLDDLSIPLEGERPDELKNSFLHNKRRWLKDMAEYLGLQYYRESRSSDEELQFLPSETLYLAAKNYLEAKLQNE